MSQQTLINFNGPGMTSDECLVWNAISVCRGKGHAVTQYELAEFCGMDPRLVRETIQTLIFKHRKPIASSPDRVKGGYYVIDNEQEAREAADRYRRQAVKIFQRAAVLLQISDLELFKQIQTEMEFK